MTRQVTDQLYIELGYHTPEQYYVYTAEAQAAATSSTSMSVTVGVIKEANSQMTATVSVTATISHIEGADLFAFTEAQIAIQIDRIRDNNIQLSDVFSVATDVSKIISIIEEESALFTFSVSETRSRDFASSQSAAFSLTADGNVVVGPTDATADLTAAFSISLQFDVIKEATGALISSTNITVSGDKVVEANSTFNSSISIEIIVDKLSGFDASLSSEFTASTSGDRFRGINSEQSVNFNLISQEERIRFGFADLNVQAEIDCKGKVSKEFASSFEFAIFTEVVAYERIRGFDSAQSSTSTTSVNEERIRGVDSQQTAQVDLTATISHIHGADLVAFSNAQLNAGANVIKSLNANITAITTQTAVGNYRISRQASLFAGSALQVGIEKRYDRPLQVAQSSSVSIVSTPVKFGAGALWLNGNSALLNYYADGRLIPELFAFQGTKVEFVVELWFYPTATRTGPLIRYSDGTTNYWTLNGNLSFNYVDSGSVTRTFTSTTSPTNSQWNHVLFVIGSNNRYGIYLNGTRIGNGTVNNEFLPIASNKGLLQISPTTDTNSTVGYIDEFRVITAPSGTVSALGYDPTQTTITQPTAQFSNTASTRFLGHYNIDFRDDISEVKTAQASLSAVATITARLSGPVKYEANLTSTSNIICFAGKNEQIVLGAFATASLTTTINVTRTTSSDQSAEFVQSVTEDYLRGFDSQVFANFAVTAQGDVNKEFNSNQTATFTEAAQVQRLAGLDGSFASQFDQAASVVKTTGNTSNIAVSAAIFVSGDLFKDNSAQISVDSTQTTDADRLRGITESFTAVASQTADLDRIRFADSQMSAAFNVVATSSGTIDFIILEVSEFTQTTIATRIQEGQSAQSSQFALTANGIKAVEGAASLNSEFSQSSIEDRLRDNNIVTDAIFIELVAAGRIGDFFINCDLTTTAIIDAVKSASGVSNQTANSQLVADLVRTQQAQANITAEASLFGDGTTNITGEVHADSAFTLVADVNETDQIAANLASEFTVTCAADRLRGFATLVMSGGTLTVDISRTRDVDIETDAIFIEMVVGTKAVEIASAMSTQFNLAASTSILHLNEYVWKITKEDRSYKIGTETREYSILEETREYIITN